MPAPRIPTVRVVQSYAHNEWRTVIDDPRRGELIVGRHPLSSVHDARDHAAVIRAVLTDAWCAGYDDAQHARPDTATLGAIADAARRLADAWRNVTGTHIDVTEVRDTTYPPDARNHRRILIVSDRPIPGGNEIEGTTLADVLAELNHRIRTLTS